jgi:hypothetical protein
MLEGLKRLFRRAAGKVEDEVEAEPVTTSPTGEERETSTNAQAGGAADEPWPGNP